MSSYFSGLNVSAWNLGGTNYLGLFKDGSVEGSNDEADARGIAQRWEYNQALKQGQIINFTQFLPGVVDTVASGLDISLWTIGGNDYLNNLRSFKINVNNATKERSSVKDAYKVPNLVSTGVEITADHLVIDRAAITNLVLTGNQAAFSVMAAFTYAGEAFSSRMLIKAGRHDFKRGEMQMENVSMKLRGTPIGPSDSSLLAIAMIGAGAVSVSIDTGANQYNTGGSQVCALTKLAMNVEDAALIEFQGTLEVQGALTVSAG